MINYSLQLNAVIVKRLGWMMEKVEVDDSILQQLEAIPIKGYRVLVPGVPRKGPCNKRWMIQENLLGRVIRTEVL
jgi:predicted transcriptional regulator of viral defense system